MLPKEVYAQLVPDEEPELLSKIIRIFKDIPENCTVDIFGEIYEYFLGNFALSEGKDGFRVAVVLPKGTNTPKPEYKPQNEEDTWMTARNKWLLAHPESSEAKSGAHIGLKGINIDIAE